MTTPTPLTGIEAMTVMYQEEYELRVQKEKELAAALDLQAAYFARCEQLCDALAAAQEALAELQRGKVLADGMANTIRGFILQRAERETLDEVAAEYRRWEEDYCHRNFRKPKP